MDLKCDMASIISFLHFTLHTHTVLFPVVMGLVTLLALLQHVE